MSQKSRKGRAQKPAAVRRPAGRKRLIALLVLSACALLAAGYAATRIAPVRRAVGLAPLPPAPAAPQGQGQLPLSKEYVYVGGRLVATEEPPPTPTPTPAGPSPTALVATLASVSGAAASVSLTWSAPASGAVASYVVERAAAAGQFAPVGQPTAVNSFTDSSAAEGAAYLYRVKAVFTSGGTSDYSNEDLATAVAFTDGQLQGAAIKAAHLTELRRAVEAVRALAGSGSASWPSNPAPAQGGVIRAAHFLELRTNLNPALTALGIAALPADSTLAVGQTVKAAHLKDVRDKVR